jgi:polar amino acid transport system permease protein
MDYTWDWSVVFNSETYSAVLSGLKYTLGVALISLALGTVIGFGAALGRLHAWKPIKALLYVYVDFFRTTPALVQLIWIYYVLPILTGRDIGPVRAGVIALSLNAGAFLCEIFRGGLESIGAGQREAAHVLGLSRFATLRHVVFPQALRRVIPATTNVFISLLKDSSLLSVIAVAEITYAIQNRVAGSYRPLELYTALAVLYFVITYPVSLAATRLEKRLRLP